MKQMNLKVIPALLLATFSGASMAAGFAASTQNASGLGNSYAGAGAAAEDASTIFFNPAGLTYLQGSQFVVGGTLVKIETTFKDQGSVAATSSTPVPLGGTGGDAGSVKLIPHAYVSIDASPDLKFGVGLGVPFGNATEWDSTWLGRFQGTKSELTTVNLNPSVAYRVNKMLSVGGGLNYQKGDAEFTQGVNGFTAILAATGSAVTAATIGGGKEGAATFKVDDDAYGWNIGVMIQPVETTRIGIAYRSKIKYKMDGNVTYSAPDATLNAALSANNAAVSVDLTMPDSFSINLAHQLTDRIEILADATWTGWSSWRELKPVRSSNGSVVTNVPYNWDDSWRAGVGANYKHSDTVKLRVGFAYDQTPSNDQYRTVTLPDSDRYWVSFGAKFALSKGQSVDVGYAHEFIKDAPINNNYGGPTGGASTPAFGLAKGEAQKSIDILGVQYNHNF
jgi:long-chain fatty acid transport protein